MTNISKRRLSKRELEQLFTQFNRIIGRLDAIGANEFMHDLLGTEERIMLAKRFAIIIMLAEKYSAYRIAQKLHVSTSTVESIRKKLNAGTYDRLLFHLGKKKQDYKSFWQTLDDILHLGGALPHYNGLDRYRGLR